MVRAIPSGAGEIITRGDIPLGWRIGRAAFGLLPPQRHRSDRIATRAHGEIQNCILQPMQMAHIGGHGGAGFGGAQSNCNRE